MFRQWAALTSYERPACARDSPRPSSAARWAVPSPQSHAGDRPRPAKPGNPARADPRLSLGTDLRARELRRLVRRAHQRPPRHDTRGASCRFHRARARVFADPGQGRCLSSALARFCASSLSTTCASSSSEPSQQSHRVTRSPPRTSTSPSAGIPTTSIASLRPCASSTPASACRMIKLGSHSRSTPRCSGTPRCGRYERPLAISTSATCRRARRDMEICGVMPGSRRSRESRCRSPRSTTSSAARKRQAGSKDQLQLPALRVRSTIVRERERRAQS